MDASTESNFVSLSYDEYLTSAEKTFHDVRATEGLILNQYDSFSTAMKLHKEQFSTLSAEDGEGKMKLTEKFVQNIKTMFLKIWQFLVEIFSKIGEIVISLIKSLIIFIQKKRIQSTNLVKLFEEKGIAGYNVANKDIFAKIFADKTIMIDTVTNSEVASDFVGDHLSIFTKLNSPQLKAFVNLPIYEKNNKSVFNIDALKSALMTNSITNDDDLDMLLNDAREYYSQAVFSNEIGKEYKPTDVYAVIKDKLDSKDMEGAAHKIVLGLTSKPKKEKVPLNKYFGIETTEGNATIEKLKVAFSDYVNLSSTVLGNNGYLMKLEGVLKRYKERVKTDHENIKAMQKYINDAVAKMNADSYDQQLSGRYNKFTNVVMFVKQAKTHFIRLRQCVIIDILTLFSIENRAWMLLSGKGKVFNDADEIPVDDKNTSSVFNANNEPSLQA